MCVVAQQQEKEPEKLAFPASPLVPITEVQVDLPFLLFDSLFTLSQLFSGKAVLAGFAHTANAKAAKANASASKGQSFESFCPFRISGFDKKSYALARRGSEFRFLADSAVIWHFVGTL